MIPIELRQLEYFVAVSNELHFTKAAEKLNISQPSLSQQIRALEHEIGMPLFDRIGKKISLTEAGRILLSHSKKVFHEVEQAHAAIQDLNGLQQGKLTIGALLTTVNYLLPPAILNFNELYPNIELSVLGLRTGEIREKLLQNELDIGITFLPVQDKEIISIPLYQNELTLVVPTNHELTQHTTVTMGVLQKYPIIFLPKNFFLTQLIRSHCQNFNFTPKPILEISTMESLIHMVSKGMGITVLPKPYIDFLQSNSIQAIKIKNPTATIEIGIIYRKDKYMCAATRMFIEQLQKIVASFQKIEI
ncbi:LysR family transcriptional regulator [Bacillus pseudomycoides]|uniref:LysR family transcriptional regulator n=1 Tax=Bacillus pseudomycoides TaxID=64104 RepID=UPI000BEC919C|nr:LysR family transcriptional regulator [Bacillus pseudomycoides]PED05668.1 LysR family transcriptional regulator [Bacillus pseudomycoides]PEI97085.1 LysR family transcriptional regulator [Bacillus pseudomycoides]PEK11087.1 LysR family transcriptional regulator [Bacillus pseudomycoides]PEM61871.1 LysR family transcriptional regulator [Bacillus pseudomycoides]PEO20855.1 LysR family transcriptional regulator [Bacillus pseudomycoides]